MTRQENLPGGEIASPAACLLDVAEHRVVPDKREFGGVEITRAGKSVSQCVVDARDVRWHEANRGEEHEFSEQTKEVLANDGGSGHLFRPGDRTGVVAFKVEDWGWREIALPRPDPFLGDDVSHNDADELQGVDVYCVWMFRGQGDALPQPLGERNDAENSQFREGDGDAFLRCVRRGVRCRVAWYDVTDRLGPWAVVADVGVDESNALAAVRVYGDTITVAPNKLCVIAAC